MSEEGRKLSEVMLNYQFIVHKDALSIFISENKVFVPEYEMCRMFKRRKKQKCWFHRLVCFN